MDHKRCLQLLLALFLCVPGAGGHACSVGPGYRRPSHFEMVLEAEVILLCRTLEFRQGGLFACRTLRVLKGTFPLEDFVVEGNSDFGGRTAEDDLDNVREGALRGSCIAEDYRVGHEYVLFGRFSGGKLDVAGPPFGRVNEEVDGETSPWTQAVLRYSEAAEIDDPEARHEALIDLLRRAQEGRDAPKIPGQMARNLAGYLHSASRWMPWPVLLEKLGAAADEPGRGRVLDAMAECDLSGHLEPVRSFLREAVRGESWKLHLKSFARLVARARETSCVAAILQASAGEMETAQALWAAGTERDVPAVLEKVRALPPKDGALLACFLLRYSGAEAQACVSDLRDRLAGEIAGNYDDHWHESVRLAGLGDAAVLSWAARDLRAAVRQGCCGLAAFIVAWSPLAEADVLVRTLIRGNRQDDLDAIVVAWKDALRSVPWQRVKEIAELPQPSPRLCRSLLDLLQGFARDDDSTALEILNRWEGEWMEQARSAPRPGLLNPVWVHSVSWTLVAVLVLACIALTLTRVSRHIGPP